MTIPALPPLPPRSATEIIDGAVQLIRPQYAYFLRIAAIGAIPALVQAVITLVVFPTASADPAELMRQQVKLLPLTLLSLTFASAQSGAMISGALAVLRGEDQPTAWAVFVAAFRRIFALLGAYLLLMVAFVVALVPVFIVVGILAAATGMLGAGLFSGTAGVVIGAVLAVLLLLAMVFVTVTFFARWSVMIALVMAEGLGPVEAFRRAHALSSGNYLLLAKTYGLLFLIVGVMYLVLVSLALAFRDQQQLLQALFSVVMIPIVPIIGSVMLLTYADLRIRREGADLDAALDALPRPDLPLA
ncbi:MAG: hypothetical protein IT355_15410 [Gemmatimonadaceae bacterium]|nr:hypothetical protein [Gemmatimonadaceae bacterium]